MSSLHEIGDLKAALEYIKGKSDVPKQIVFTTFCLELSWFRNSIFNKFYSQFDESQRDNISLFYERVKGDGVSPQTQLTGKIKNHFAVSIKGGIFHPKIFYADLGNEVLFGLGSANLDSNHFSSTRIEFQRIWKFENKEREYISGFVKALLQEVKGNLVHDGQTDQLDQVIGKFKGEYRPDKLPFYLNSGKKNCLMQRVHELLQKSGTTSIKEAFVLSPFFSDEMGGLLDKAIDKKSQLSIDENFSLPVDKINIMCRETDMPLCFTKIPKKYFVLKFDVKTINPKTEFHSKATVLEAKDGARKGQFLVIWGSTNFTRTAWSGKNIEVDHIEWSESNPLLGLMENNFEPKESPSSIKSKSSELDEDYEYSTIKYASIDCLTGSLSFALDIKNKLKKSLSLDQKSKDLCVEIKIGKKSNFAFEIKDFFLGDWISSGKVPVLRLFEEGVEVDSFPVFLLNIPVGLIDEESGKVNVPETIDEEIELILNGNFSVSRPDQEDITEDDDEDPQEDIPAELQGGVGTLYAHKDDYYGLCDIVSRLLSPLIKGIQSGIREKDYSAIQRLFESVEILWPRFYDRAYVDKANQSNQVFYQLFTGSLEDLILAHGEELGPGMYKKFESLFKNSKKRLKIRIKNAA